MNTTKLTWEIQLLSFTSNQKSLIDSLRPGQKELANWQGGKMAVAAVPGAGKSYSLSVAAALTIARAQLNLQRQLVIVTYTRSAAAGIKQKIRDCLKQMGLPQWGFTVHTLHGLALNIASRNPELHSLNFDTATVISPNRNHQLIRNCVEAWISDSPYYYQRLIEGVRFDGEEAEKLRRQSVLRTEALPSLAYTVIREAKSSGLLPQDLWELSQQAKDEYQILAIAAGLYNQYQQLMTAQNFIDYDDLILAALKVLENETVRKTWQGQIYAVFEDEAQDSSLLQEKLISLLAANPDSDKFEDTNLVRVGDPNQAINTTFTPADPLYFNWFCQTCQQQNKLVTMNQAGRSSRVIIASANYVLQWINEHWDKKGSQPLNLPFRNQEIVPVAEDDPQPDANPTPEDGGVEIHYPEDVYNTVELIGQRVELLLQKSPDHSAAILVRENRQSNYVAQKLKYLQKQAGIRVYEVAEAERYSQIPQEILSLLLFIHRPHSPDNIKRALEILQQRQLIPSQDLNILTSYPEQFLYPTLPEKPGSLSPDLVKTRRYCCNLLKAKIELPHYQLIAFLGMTLKYTGSELATVQKLSEKVHQQIRGRNSLASAITVLQEIVTNETFEAVEEDNEEQYTRANQLTIITMHKAKGLDWDYVFIPFLHSNILPGKLNVPLAAKFLGEFTLADVARGQLRSALHSQYQGNFPIIPDPLKAWTEAEKLKKAEEYRLLYVAMTRAKRLLWLSAAKQGPYRWSNFRAEGVNNLQNLDPCPVLSPLNQFLRNK